jgi:type III restriction enzyme
MFDEDWPRYVLKMATGAGKTKVLSLLIAWSFFHKLYETDSVLSRNFLVIAPNIIVLDRLRADFDGLRIFFNDPILPSNGNEGRNWRDDFQLTLHIQDDVRVVRDTGNLFLTNIHRVFLGDVADPSLEDDDLREYFLSPFGPKPVGKTTDSKTDLGDCPRSGRIGRLQRRGPPHPQPQDGLVQIHSGYSSQDVAKGSPLGLANRRYRYTAP